MFKNLSAPAIGIRGLTLRETIQLAAETGFTGIDFNIREAADLADQHGVEHVRSLFSDSGVIPGQWGLPVNWNGPEADWRRGLDDLPRLAALGVELGCRRTTTWCPSWSDERGYDENFAWHVERYRPIAEILDEHGCRLGIEFLGPKTLRTNHKYDFIATIDQMNELFTAITPKGHPGNVGHLLDAWHLFTSGGTLEDMDTLSNDDIVAVHVNDAPPGVPFDEVIDTQRHLPLETGVLDLVGFMRKLDAMGYDGPVTVEPFSQSLNDLASRDPQAAARRTAQAMDDLWQKAGL